MNYIYSNQKEIDELEEIKSNLVGLSGYNNIVLQIEEIISELYKTSSLEALIVSTDMDKYIKDYYKNKEMIWYQ